LLIGYGGILLISVLSKSIKNNEVICQASEILQLCLIRHASEVIDLDNVEGFSILSAASLYILDSRERRYQTIHEAWQIIDAAAAARVPTSYARNKALQDLCKYQIPLEGLDVPGADLRRIDLSKADLRCPFVFSRPRSSNGYSSISHWTHTSLEKLQLNWIVYKP
jgi:hypothetical protein